MRRSGAGSEGEEEGKDNRTLHYTNYIHAFAFSGSCYPPAYFVHMNSPPHTLACNLHLPHPYTTNETLDESQERKARCIPVVRCRSVICHLSIRDDQGTAFTLDSGWRPLLRVLRR